MEPNTEQIFSTQVIEDSLQDSLERSNENDEDNESTYSTSDQIASDDSFENDIYKADDEELDQNQIEKERRREILKLKDDNIFSEVKYTQEILKLFEKTDYVYPPLEQPRVLTQEEIDDNEMVRRTFTGNIRDDMVDMFYVNEKIPVAEDETLPEVKELVLTKGFISARQVHEIITHSQANPSSNRDKEVERILDDYDIEAGVFTQIEIQEKKNQTKKCNDDPGPEVFEKINKQELLNNSLGSLSQKLNNSQHFSEIVKSSCSQHKLVDLDVTFGYIEEPLIDDEANAVKCTEELEFDFDVATQVDDSICLPKVENEYETLPDVSKRPDQPRIYNSRESKLTLLKNKEAGLRRLEEGFGCQDYQSTQDIMLGLNMPSTSNQAAAPKVFSGFGFASGKSVEIKDLSSVRARFDLEDRANINEIRKKFNIEVPNANEDSSFEVKIKSAPLKHFKVPSASPAPSTSATKKNLNSNNQHDPVLTPEPVKSKLHLNQSPLPSPSFSPIVPPPAMFMPSTSGFTTASGKNTAIDSKKLQKFQILFEKEDQMMEEQLLKDIESPISTSATKKSLNLNNHDEPKLTLEPVKSKLHLNQSPLPSPSFSPNVPSPAMFMPSTSGFTTASGKNTAIDSKKLQKFQKLFEKEDQMMEEQLLEDIESPIKPAFKKLKLDFGSSPIASSPFMMDSFKKGIAQHSTPLVSRRQGKAPGIEVSSIAPLCSIAEEESLEDFKDIAQPPKKKFAKTCLINKFNDSIDSNTSLIDFDELDSIVMQHQTIYQVDEEVKCERERALEQQKRSVAEKAGIDRAPMAGTVFMMKSAKNRKKVSDYVKQAQPKSLDRHFITFFNAIDYKFTMQNYYDTVTCRTNFAGITLADNARLIMNPQSKVGVNEITWSFLSSPGVDPKLVTERWIQNAFKMIVLKLSHLENSFENFDKYELLNPENVLLQIKYRYDREIDKFNRSAIKKLTEGDDVSCRRMVLKVVDIIDVPNIGFELQLSDGWYSIRTSIDAALADAVQSKKIIVGTKLVISCAELIGCIACDPLDLIENVRFKIHANSTRRTHWDAKMGFCKNPTQIQVPLDSILATGGIIGKITVAVTHVYPTIYVDSSGPIKEFRSEKLQRRIENKLDILNYTIFEAITHQVQEEELKNVKERVMKLKASKKKLKELDAEEICDLLDLEIDVQESIAIQKQLDVKTLETVRTIRDERDSDIRERILKQLGEKTNSLMQIIKFRVVDAIKPKETAIISCWSPSEDLLDILKEGKTLEIFNSMAGPQTDEIQVTVGKSSALRLSKVKIPEEKLEKFFRKETKISHLNFNFKPPQNEFDLACVVFEIEPFNSKESQKVFVADENFDILCINFWKGISAAAFDDVIKVNTVVYARNLQWRLAHATDKLPKAFVQDDVTLFIIRPMNQSQQRRLDDLKASVGDIEVFVRKCIDKLSTLKKSSTTNKENRSENISLSNGTDPIKPSTLKSLPVKLSNEVNTTISNSPSTPVLPRIDSISRSLARHKRRLGTYSNLSSNVDLQKVSESSTNRRVI